MGLQNREGALADVTGRSVSHSPLAFPAGFLGYLLATFHFSGNTGVELVECLSSIRSTQELNSRGSGFVLGGLGGVPFCFFQTIQSLLLDKISLVLQHRSWYTST